MDNNTLNIKNINSKVEILTIGDELLIGQVIDTNSAWMAQELNKAGFSVSRIISVGDNESAILEALKGATQRAKIVLITGGLGPTRDDITKKTLCKFFNTKLVFNEDVYTDIVEMLSKRMSNINQLNKEQALVPEICEVIRNPEGTAPILWFNSNENVVISMPGVPFEMKFAMSENIIPRLKKMFKTDVIIHKTINIYNIPESVLAEKLTEWENNLPPFIKLAYLPAYGKIRLRLTAIGDKTIQDEIQQKIDSLYPIIGENIYGLDDISAPEMLLNSLKKKNATIATAESCTGGYIAHLITSISGASDCYKGSIIAYSNQLKMSLLDVNKEVIEKYGAVSQQVVEQMAQGICKNFDTDYAIATSGIAGPTGGTQQKPVGTVWIAWANKKEVKSELFNMGNNRERTITRTSETAIISLKMMLEKGF